MSETDVRNDIGLLLAITGQLFQTRMTHLVGIHELTYTQFSLLSHLRGVGTPEAVSSIADAMEINQPGVTKVVQRLADDGLVVVEADPGDSRRRLVRITADAIARLDEVGETLAADADGWFAGWSDQQLTEFRDRLGDLVTWLDGNRVA